MTSIEFSKSFHFHLYNHRHAYSTDMTHAAGCPTHYIGRMIRGTAKIVMEKETLQLQPGDVFYLPQGLQYRSTWYPDEEAVEFYSFGFRLLPLARPVSLLPQKIECTAEDLLLLSKLEQTLEVTPASVGYLYSFIGNVLDRLAATPLTEAELLQAKVSNYIRRHPRCPVKDIAAHCAISESGLYAKLQHYFGKTPVQLQQEFLCREACSLLTATDISVEEISDRLGFSSCAYFRKVFRKHTGQTPTDYRKHHQRI